jgi:hypothetical protein
VGEVHPPEAVAAPERVAKAETLDDRGGNREPHQAEPRNRGQDRGDREEGHEEVDRDADEERAENGAPVGPHSRRDQASADV